MNKHISKTMTLLTVFIMAFAMLESTLAFGVAANYLKDDTMTVAPGESRDYSLEIQNAQSSPIDAVVSVESTVATVVNQQPTYRVGGDTPTTAVVLRISVPKDATVGASYPVRYTVTPASVAGEQAPINLKFSGGFTVKVGTSSEQKATPPQSSGAPVVVAKKNESPATNTWILIAGVLMVLFVLAALLVWHHPHPQNLTKRKR